MTRYQRIARVFGFRDLDVYERAVLLLMCHRSIGGVVRSPQKSLAHALDISERKVRDCVKSMEIDGYIKRTKTTLGKSGIQHIDSITLACTKPGFLEPRRAARGAGLPAARGAAPLYKDTRRQKPAGRQSASKLRVIDGGLS